MVLVFHYKNYMSKSVCEIVLPFFGKTKFLRVQRTRFLPQLLYLELFSFQCAIANPLFALRTLPSL